METSGGAESCGMKKTNAGGAVEWTRIMFPFTLEGSWQRVCMTETVASKNGVPIRLTDERWVHITEEHSELASLRLEVLETVANPAEIFAGNLGEHLAVRAVEPGKYLVVVYREFPHDGFIITAFLARRVQALRRRQQLWPL